MLSNSVGLTLQCMMYSANTYFFQKAKKLLITLETLMDTITEE